MNKTHLYDLAYEFRNSKVWKQIFEAELFAVKLPRKSAGENIAYCSLMGRGGEHMALAVYIGAEAFTSYRRIAAKGLDYSPGNMSNLLVQDCIQCSIEQRDQFGPDELDELKAYCKKAGISFRAPFPQFTRFYPYCVPWKVSETNDWSAMEASLSVITKLAGELKKYGKSALGLRPIAVELHSEAYASEQLDLFDDTIADDVTIPLYSIRDGNLVTERVPLPPYTERPLPAPTQFNDITMAKLMRKKQRGVYECELIRLPEPVDGKPPYLPAMLLTVDGDGLVLHPAMSSKPMYDPDEMINEFVSALGDAYPKTIKVRTVETKSLLEEFCRRAKIRLVDTEELDLLDEAVDSMMYHMGYGYDEEEEGGDIDDLIEMLGEMTLEDIRMLPDMILDQMLEAAELFPPEIVKK